MQCCFSLGKLTGLHWPRGARADDIHIGVTRWIDPVTYNLCNYLEESRMSFIKKQKLQNSLQLVQLNQNHYTQIKQ